MVDSSPGDLNSDQILAGLESALGLNIRKEELEIEVIRELGEAESSALRPARTKQQDLRVLRQSHHQLARLIAQRRSLSDCALITGYSMGAIENLKENQAFRELVASYKITEDLTVQDLASQEALLKFATMAKLQRLLEDEPEGGLKEFTIGQLHDQLKALQSKAGPSGGLGSGGFAPQVNVSFVQGGNEARNKDQALEVDFHLEPPK